MSVKLPVIETQRLLLRVPIPDDSEEICRFVNENSQHNSPWDPVHPPEYFTKQYWEQEIPLILRTCLRGDSMNLFLFHGEEDQQKIIGKVNFSNIVRGAFQAAHLGFGIDYRFEGKGFMREALDAAISYAFSHMNLHRIMANYMPANSRSEKLLQCLGFVREGFAEKYLYLAGDWQDHVLTSLTNLDWEQRD